MRDLTEQQKRRLILAARGHISTETAKSMPSLERRGLAERYWHREGGSRWRLWRLTAAGYRLAEQLWRAGNLEGEGDASG